jgi:Uma2 family endonuclease
MAINEYKPIVIGDVIAENVSEAEFFANYEGHFEWVDGKVIKMPPITLLHSLVTDYLRLLLKVYLESRNLGRTLGTPFAMRLSDISRVRQPDIFVILGENQHNLTEYYFDGAADICIEVVSPTTVITDRGVKFEEYQQGGVTEYWIIDPLRKEALFYRLDEKVYKPQPIQNDVYETPQLPKLQLHVPTLWDDELPDMRDILQAVEKMLAG